MNSKLFKTTFMALFFLAFVNLSAQDLYLIIGQSNAAGRDTNFDFNGEDQPSTNVRLFNSSGSFEVAQQPLNEYSTVRKTTDQGVSFGLRFGTAIHAYTGNTTYLVSNARGGTKVAQWRKGKGTGYFEEAVERVQAAEAECGCSLKGILWHQGEGNVSSADGSYTSSYYASLIAMISEFRDELGDVPFLAGQLFHNDKNDNFNDDLREIDDSDFPLDNVDWVTAKKLTTLDGTHFTAASTRLLGRRYAKIMRDYVGNDNANARIDITEDTDLHVYPNPASEIIRVDGAEEEDVFEIYNMLGVKVMESTDRDIDVSALKDGFYFVRTRKKNKIQKFIKGVEFNNLLN